MDNSEFEYYLDCSRIRKDRTRKRNRLKDLDKEMLRLYRERVALRKKIMNLGWVPLNPPMQRGYIRFFIQIAESKKTDKDGLFENILQKINSRQWSYRKDFKRKRGRSKKIYVVREQLLHAVTEREFFGKGWTDKERAFFEERIIHLTYSKSAAKVYVFTEPWRFVLKVYPHIITKVRVKSIDLEKREAEIDKHLDTVKSARLYRLLDASGGKWETRPKEKYEDPFRNKSFPQILNENLTPDIPGVFLCAYG